MGLFMESLYPLRGGQVKKGVGVMIINGDARNIPLGDKTVQVVITSPP